MSAVKLNDHIRPLYSRLHLPPEKKHVKLEQEHNRHFSLPPPHRSLFSAIPLFSTSPQRRQLKLELEFMFALFPTSL